MTLGKSFWMDGLSRSWYFKKPCELNIRRNTEHSYSWTCVRLISYMHIAQTDKETIIYDFGWKNASNIKV